MTRDEADARRYRWLRERWGRISETYAGDTDIIVAMGDDPEGWPVNPGSLDAAIDGAIAGTRYELTDAGIEALERGK